MDKGDLIIAVLATFCLTATLFMILPIRGQSGEYDPWLDLNDDGSINILESILVGNHFLTNGDPTKNVTIWRASKLAFTVSGYNVLAGNYLYSGWINAEGYSKVTISIYHTSTANTYHLEVAHVGFASSFIVETLTNIDTDFVKTYDVPNQQVDFMFRNDGVGSCTIYMDVYLIA